MSDATTSTVAHLENLLENTKHVHNARFSSSYIASARQAYAAKYALFNALTHAEHEGVLEVTIRTSTQTITVPIGRNGVGEDFTTPLMEILSAEMGVLQRKIIAQLVEFESAQEQADENGTSLVGQAFALCLPQPEAIAPAAPMQGQSTATPPRLRAARAHRDAEATA